MDLEHDREQKLEGQVIGFVLLKKNSVLSVLGKAVSNDSL